PEVAAEVPSLQDRLHEELKRRVSLTNNKKAQPVVFVTPLSSAEEVQFWLSTKGFAASEFLLASTSKIADALAKAGADDASVPSAPLTYLELFSRAKSRNKTIWLIPPEHHWYQGSRPGGCLSIDCSRRGQTTLTRFLSGHIRSLTFSGNSKCFEICPKCIAEQATPDHILACLGLSK
ncbi:hypothetical protein AVEN_10745-1, partial [Araneus ventricosus]